MTETAFIKRLTSLDRSRGTHDKFRDLCELAYCAFAKLTAPTEARAEELETRYMSIVNRYQDKDTIRAYPELIGMGWKAVKDGGCDFLGTVAAQLEILDAHNGQFFTPWPVSRMMAEMLVGECAAEIQQQGYTRMSEPACGAGGMVLAFADALAGQGFDPAIDLLVHAVDVSPLCYYMAYLQLTWRGIPAYVERANTLSLESFEGAWTPATAGFYERHGQAFEGRQVETQAEAPIVYPELLEMPKFVQLQLF